MKPDNEQPKIVPPANPRKRYGKKLIYEHKDPGGSIQVLEDRNTRSLHFGGKEKQSAMNLKDHEELVLSYTKTMMAALLLKKSPKNILILGLGGGSMAKFLLKLYPECNINIVDNSEQVVQIAYDLFYLPKIPNISVFIADAKEFLAKQKSTQYDLIFIDVFDEQGMSDSVTGFTFFNRCRNLLARDGWVVFNLWYHPESLHQTMVYYIKKAFYHQILEIPSSCETNHILFGSEGILQPLTLSDIMGEAKLLKGKAGLDFPKLTKELHRHNASFFNESN